MAAHTPAQNERKPAENVLMASRVLINRIVIIFEEPIIINYNKNDPT